MSRSRTLVALASLMCFSFIVLTAHAVAAQKKSRPASKAPAAASAGAADVRSIDGVVVRAHSIAGMSVKDPAGKNLGKVEDVVIDMETGSVQYVPVAFG